MQLEKVKESEKVTVGALVPISVEYVTGCDGATLKETVSFLLLL